MKSLSKTIITIITLIIMLTLTGCIIPDEESYNRVLKGTVKMTMTHFDNTFKFIKENNYSANDITESEYSETDRNEEYKLTLKNIKCDYIFSNNSNTVQVLIVAPKNADIKDIVNCCNYFFNYAKKSTNYQIFYDSINQTLKTGKQVTIPIKSDVKSFTASTNINNDNLSIIMSEILTADNKK